MKKAITRTSMMTMVFISLFIMGFKNGAFSNDVHSNPIELKAIEKFNNQPVFELKLNNAEEADYLVRVKDSNGDVLYSEKLTGKNLSRKYRIDVNFEELNEVFNLRFEVTNVKTRQKSTYNVTQTNRVVPEIIIAGL